MLRAFRGLERKRGKSERIGREREGAARCRGRYPREGAAGTWRRREDEAGRTPAPSGRRRKGKRKKKRIFLENPLDF